MHSLKQAAAELCHTCTIYTIVAAFALPFQSPERTVQRCLMPPVRGYVVRGTDPSCPHQVDNNMFSHLTFENCTIAWHQRAPNQNRGQDGACLQAFDNKNMNYMDKTVWCSLQPTKLQDLVQRLVHNRGFSKSVMSFVSLTMCLLRFFSSELGTAHGLSAAAATNRHSGSIPAVETASICSSRASSKI